MIPVTRLAATTRRLSGVSRGASPVLDQLRRVAELQRRVAAENSKWIKQDIIAEYPDLRDLLEHVYDPSQRTHLSSSTLRKHLETSPTTPVSDDHVPPTLSSRFDALSSRSVTGNQAKDLVASFLRKHGVLDTESPPDGSVEASAASTDGAAREASAVSSSGPPGERDAAVDHELVGVFERLLDRNLVAGFGARTLSNVPWPRCTPTPIPPSSDVGPERVDTSLPGVDPGETPNPPSLASSSNPDAAALSPARSLETFQCALGKTIEPPFSDLAKHPRWFASRKLDGVRALALLNFLVPSDGASPRFDSARFVSRSGKPFRSLSNLGSQLRHVESFPRLGEWLGRDPKAVRTQHDGVVKRLILDGEVCVMRPRSADEMQRMAKRHDDGTGAAALWVDKDGLVEDFPATTSEIRRTNHTIEHPAYFLFDVLSWGEVSAKSALAPPLGRGFGERIADLKELTQWVDAELERQGVKEMFTRMLVQWQVKSEQQADVQGMVHRAADEGWEGLIFRADKPYKGTRSPDIRKFKQWQDADNVWIGHKGTPVSVGSGFTAEQRLAYAKDPSLIVGKEITVEYFSESEAAGRPGALSLRFPRIKTVWEGRRDV